MLISKTGNSVSSIPIQANWQKHTNNEQPVIGEAAEVFISSKARELAKAPEAPDGDLTPAEAELKSRADAKDIIQQRKDRIKEIDKQLAEDDGTLTDDDKSILQKERDKLEAESKTPEDKLHELYAKKHKLEKDIDSGKYTTDDIAVIGNEIAFYSMGIEELKRGIKEDAEKEQQLEIQAIQERGDLDVDTARAKESTETEIPEAVSLTEALAAQVERITEQNEARVSVPIRPSKNEVHSTKYHQP